jgi:hypothetical protein
VASNPIKNRKELADEPTNNSPFSNTIIPGKTSLLDQQGNNQKKQLSRYANHLKIEAKTPTMHDTTLAKKAGPPHFCGPPIPQKPRRMGLPGFEPGSRTPEAHSLDQTSRQPRTLSPTLKREPQNKPIPTPLNPNRQILTPHRRSRTPCQPLTAAAESKSSRL